MKVTTVTEAQAKREAKLVLSQVKVKYPGLFDTIHVFRYGNGYSYMLYNKTDQNPDNELGRYDNGFTVSICGCHYKGTHLTNPLKAVDRAFDEFLKAQSHAIRTADLMEKTRKHILGIEY